MMYNPTTQPQRYDAALPQPVYPPYLMTAAGGPSGQPAFGPAEPAQPSALAGFPTSTTPSTAPTPVPGPVASHQQPPAQQAGYPQPQIQPQHAQPQTPAGYPQPQQPDYFAQPAYQPAQSAYQPAQTPLPGYAQPAVQPGYHHPAYPTTPQNLTAHQQAYAAYHQGRGVSAEPAAPVRRPRVLTLAVGVGLAAAALTVVSQGLALVNGRSAVEAEIEARLPGGSEQFRLLIDAAVDQAYRTLQARAFLSIGISVLVAVLLVLCLRAHLAARIGAVLGMAVSGLLLLVCALDIFPGTAQLVAWAALALLGPTTLLLFMPGIGRYRASRSQAARVGAPIAGRTG